MIKNKPNILIISYFFTPDKRVGALRTSYWYKELPKYYDCNLEIFTAEKDTIGEGVHVIPQTGSFSRFALIKDAGLLWKKNVKDYLSKNTINPPDLVIISGSPFMHFSLAKEFKAKFSCKVILDYRDPFSINPGFNNSSFKIQIKKAIEKRFNRNADALVTVNAYCAKLIQGFDEKQHAIVQNGYDETIEVRLKKISPENLSFSYAGKFYFHPQPIIDALKELNLPLVYAGPDENLLGNLADSMITSKGFVNYADSVQLIADSAVGIIQTYGEEFQSTTKIFDYVRCNRIILIVSNKHILQGSIHEELKTYPNVYWAKNDKNSILEAIKLIRDSEYIEPEASFHLKFSRKAQMLKLIDLIERM